MEDMFERSTLDAVLHAMDTERLGDGLESDEADPMQPGQRTGRILNVPFSPSPDDEASRFARAQRTIRPRPTSSPKPLAAGANDGILLVGGPYRGTYVRENLDANGVYLVSGALGDFVYRLYQRKQERAIAVPFDATLSQIRDALFRQAGKYIARPKARPTRNACAVGIRTTA